VSIRATDRTSTDNQTDSNHERIHIKHTDKLNVSVSVNLTNKPSFPTYCRVVPEVPMHKLGN